MLDMTKICRIHVNFTESHNSATINTSRSVSGYIYPNTRAACGAVDLSYASPLILDYQIILIKIITKQCKIATTSKRIVAFNLFYSFNVSHLGLISHQALNRWWKADIISSMGILLNIEKQRNVWQLFIQLFFLRF